MRPLIAGNWKMNGLSASLGEIDKVCALVAAEQPAADILICPPATLIAQASWMAKGRIAIGGQDCREEISGAFTGDISAEMLKDAGASAVIVGHSERRHFHAETDAMVADKAMAAWRAGITAIICVGESEAEREAGHALDVCGRQIAHSVPDGMTTQNTAVAYEPIWAIGTGRTPTVAEIAEVHAHIRMCLTEKFPGEADGVRILYGGSVKPSNAAEMLAVKNVGGALVGGASLKASDFHGIFSAVPKH
ncbi:MAG TPA: triose-phosphate isomerase [Rhizomicrobium sp.]|jgi:triosephosphate isomerase|nr:triose-phosphate isomerase [Rhizomicrobium sp.]